MKKNNRPIGVPKSNVTIIPSGSHQWDYISISSCSKFLLYSETSRRRTVFLDRKYD